MIVVSVVTVFANDQNPFIRKPKGAYKPGIDPEIDKAVHQAQKVYQQKKSLGEDFSSGPCLTNDLLPDWVADIVHNPRQPIDDEPRNHCQAFSEGRAKHFIELDPEGNVVRIY